MTTTYNPQNIFAKILRGEIPSTKVFENEWVLAIRDITPQAPVHVLIVPKKAYISFADFSATASDEEIAAYTRAVGHIARDLGIEESGYRLITNAGPNSGQEVPHFHVHMLGGAPLGALVGR